MSDRYEDITDEELIDRLREGQSQIMDYIMDKYKNLVRKKAKSMYILGADNEDLIQEGMIGLFKAIRDYDAGRDASFYTFADLCISRRMYNAVQASRREKHAPLNSYIMQSWRGRRGMTMAQSLSMYLLQKWRQIRNNFLSIRKMWLILRQSLTRSLAALKNRYWTCISQA